MHRPVLGKRRQIEEVVAKKCSRDERQEYEG
jgi:hypothetical protein